MAHTFTTLRRSLLRQKGHAAINLFGLAIGLAACVLIFLYARNELTWDRFHPEAGRTHLVLKQRHLPSGDQLLTDTWLPLANALQQRYPEVEAAVRVQDLNTMMHGGDRNIEGQVTLTDAPFFDLFDFPLRGGRHGSSVLEERKVVVSEELADRLFGDPARAVGQTIEVEEKAYEVGGVLAPYPRNSSLQPAVVIPFRAYIDPDEWELAGEYWDSSFLWTFVRLREGVDPQAFEVRLDEFIEFQFGTSGPNGRGNMEFNLLPLTDWHEYESSTRTLSLSLVVIAGIILIIAVVNFTNLSTATSFRRAKEIGLRKVLGARRRDLVRQFLTESILLSLLALVLAVFLVELLLPWMNGYFGIDVRLPLLESWQVPAALLGFGLLLGLLAGLYPALVLSGFDSNRTMRGETTRGRGGAAVRTALIGLQFVLAIVLLSMTGVVWQQIRYMKTTNLQLNSEAVLTVEYSLADRIETLREALATLVTARDEIGKLAGVAEVALSSGVPGDYMNANVFARPEGYEGDVPFRVLAASADDRFFELYDMSFIAGGPFTAEMVADDPNGENAKAAIVNETAARMMGLLDDPNAAIGSELHAGGRRELVGIVADHHVAPLTETIRPLVYFPGGATQLRNRYLSVKLNAGDAGGTLDRIEHLWARVDPDGVFDFTFADDRLARLYAAQERIITLAGLFALIGVLIASVGLLGLVSYAVTLRTKEIGIRKVLGANLRHILALLGREHLAPVLLANLAAWPLAWYLALLYLREFPYRMGMPWQVFLLASLLAFTLAALTLTLTAWRSASGKPTEALRHE